MNLRVSLNLKDSLNLKLRIKLVKADSRAARNEEHGKVQPLYVNLKLVLA